MTAVPQKFFYKPVAIIGGRFFCLSGEKMELIIGEKAESAENGAFTVFRTLEGACSYARDKGPLPQKTVLKVMAWGHCTELGDERLLFAHVCPLFNIGLLGEGLKKVPWRESKQKRSELRTTCIRQDSSIRKRLLSMPYWKQISFPVPFRAEPRIKQRIPRLVVSVKRSLEYPAVEIKRCKASLSVGRRIHKKLVPFSIREQLQQIEKNAMALEQEVYEVERRAALLRLEEDLDLTDSVDMTPALREQ